MSDAMEKPNDTDYLKDVAYLAASEIDTDGMRRLARQPEVDGAVRISLLIAAARIDGLEEYADLLARNLSDAEAREMVWPAMNPAAWPGSPNVSCVCSACVALRDAAAAPSTPEEPV
jgi:hypothetical protein